MPRSVLPLLAIALLALAANACTDGDGPNFPYELYLARVDGGKPILLSRSQNFQPVYWSSDGRMAYLHERAGPRTEIRVLQPGSTASATVPLDGSAVGINFEWANGGIFISREYPCEPCIERQFIKLPPLFAEREPDDLGDGAAIRAVALPQYPDLVLIDSGGRRIRTLFRGNDRWQFVGAQVSPDREWVTFVRFHCRDSCEAI